MAFSAQLIEEEAERLGFDKHDVEGGCYLYDYANVGHVADRWGKDFWWACPASYSRKNPTPALPVAQAAIEAAQWIRDGVPSWALDGQPPTPRMSALIQVCLTYWRLEEAEAKVEALKDLENKGTKP